MISFEENTIHKWKIEVDIMNSNPSYNRMSKNKATVQFQDIQDEYEESHRLKTVRLMVKQNEKYIGLVDYCLENPSDKLPWISLFVIHADKQGAGISTKVYRQLEQLIKQQGKDNLRLAVHKENEKAVVFWTKMGFTKFKEVTLAGKLHDCLEKELIR
ncbi:GNAT family N-acetyltransferase [Jeotgalibacillus proteolyticus]|uniref:GNAT family N-acetyltransferase n=1 Tax=Jeotgalibacillus proteolyticus TaxID=2082395 RepID=UPI003CF838E3